MPLGKGQSGDEGEGSNEKVGDQSTGSQDSSSVQKDVHRPDPEDQKRQSPGQNRLRRRTTFGIGPPDLGTGQGAAHSAAALPAPTGARGRGILGRGGKWQLGEAEQ